MKAPESRPSFASVGILDVTVKHGVFSETVDFFTKDLRTAKRVAVEFEIVRINGVRPNGSQQVIYYLKNLPGTDATSFLESIGVPAQEFVPGSGMQHWLAPAGAIPTPE